MRSDEAGTIEAVKTRQGFDSDIIANDALNSTTDVVQGPDVGAVHAW